MDALSKLKKVDETCRMYSALTALKFHYGGTDKYNFDNFSEFIKVIPEKVRAKFWRDLKDVV